LIRIDADFESTDFKLEKPSSCKVVGPSQIPASAMIAMFMCMISQNRLNPAYKKAFRFTKNSFVVLLASERVFFENNGMLNWLLPDTAFPRLQPNIRIHV